MFLKKNNNRMTPLRYVGEMRSPAGRDGDESVIVGGISDEAHRRPSTRKRGRGDSLIEGGEGKTFPYNRECGESFTEEESSAQWGDLYDYFHEHVGEADLIGEMRSNYL